MSEGIATSAAPAEAAPIESNEEVVENQVDSGDEVVEESDKPETKKEEVSRKKKYQLQVNKKMKEIEVDLDNDEEVTKYLQKAAAADEKFAESAEIRKAAIQFIEELRANPKKVLRDPNFNIDLKKFAQEILDEDAVEAAKSPEQKRIEDLQAQLEEINNKKAQDEEDRKTSEMKRLESEAETKISSDITSALEQGNLPKTPYTVKKMAEMMMLALQNDVELTAQEIVPLLKKQMSADMREMLSASSDEVLDEFIDKNIQDRLRKRNVAKSRKAVDTANSVKATGNKQLDKSEEKAEKPVSYKDFFGI